MDRPGWATHTYVRNMEENRIYFKKRFHWERTGDMIVDKGRALALT